ncbi:MAG TPA: MarR family transcriptional regulator [Pseudonocardiaceae bacterium]|jgi:DNA-binding MarR family transcriptional regulator
MTDLRTLFHHLVRLEIELWDALDQRLQAELDLSMGNLDVLLAIQRTPNARVHDVARELSITVGGTSKAIDRLEAAGRCARTPNPQDRRSSIIEITTAGADLLERALVIFDAELELRLGSVLPEESLTRLSTSLAMLREAGQVVQERITTT